MTAIDAGPYMNEDGDWWVPVSAMHYLEARRYVKQHLYGEPEDTRLIYRGRETVALDTAHAAFDCEPDECESTYRVEAWHFFEEER